MHISIYKSKVARLWHHSVEPSLAPLQADVNYPLFFFIKNIIFVFL